MVRHWPFLRALIDDVEMVLAKADMAIAAINGVTWPAIASGTAMQLYAMAMAKFCRTNVPVALA